MADLENLVNWDDGEEWSTCILCKQPAQTFEVLNKEEGRSLQVSIEHLLDVKIDNSTALCSRCNGVLNTLQYIRRMIYIIFRARKDKKINMHETKYWEPPRFDEYVDDIHRFFKTACRENFTNPLYRDMLQPRVVLKLVEPAEEIECSDEPTDFVSRHTPFRSSSRRSSIGIYRGRPRSRSARSDPGTSGGGRRGHYCSTCGYSCYELSDLSRHLIEFHNFIANYICEICQQRFTSKYYLNKHQTLTHKPKDIDTCPECNMSTKSFTSAKRHAREHTFQCKICEMRFLTAANLRQHRQKDACKATSTIPTRDRIRDHSGYIFSTCISKPAGENNKNDKDVNGNNSEVTVIDMIQKPGQVPNPRRGWQTRLRNIAPSVHSSEKISQLSAADPKTSLLDVSNRNDRCGLSVSDELRNLQNSRTADLSGQFNEAEPSQSSEKRDSDKDRNQYSQDQSARTDEPAANVQNIKSNAEREHILHGVRVMEDSTICYQDTTLPGAVTEQGLQAPIIEKVNDSRTDIRSTNEESLRNRCEKNTTVNLQRLTPTTLQGFGKHKEQRSSNSPTVDVQVDKDSATVLAVKVSGDRPINGSGSEEVGQEQITSVHLAKDFDSFEARAAIKILNQDETLLENKESADNHVPVIEKLPRKRRRLLYDVRKESTALHIMHAVIPVAESRTIVPHTENTPIDTNRLSLSDASTNNIGSTVVIADSQPPPSDTVSGHDLVKCHAAHTLPNIETKESEPLRKDHVETANIIARESGAVYEKDLKTAPPIKGNVSSSTTTWIKDGVKKKSQSVKPPKKNPKPQRVSSRGQSSRRAGVDFNQILGSCGLSEGEGSDQGGVRAGATNAGSEDERHSGSGADLAAIVEVALSTAVGVRDEAPACNTATDDVKIQHDSHRKSVPRTPPPAHQVAPNERAVGGGSESGLPSKRKQVGDVHKSNAILAKLSKSNSNLISVEKLRQHDAVYGQTIETFKKRRKRRD